MGGNKNISGRVSAVPQRTKWTAEEDALLRQHAPDYKLLLKLLPHKTHAALACRHQRNQNNDNPSREKQKESTDTNQIRDNIRRKQKRAIEKTRSSCVRNKRGVMVPVVNCVARAISSLIQATKARDTQKNYMQNRVNKDRVNKQARDRRVNDPVYRAERNLRSRLADYARTHGFIKGASTERLLKCSYKEFEARMSSFDENHDNCEYDHIFPMSRYDLGSKDNQLRCMHHTNFQPLTITENRTKSAKLPTKAMAARVDRDCWPDGVTEDMLPDIYPGWATPLRMHVNSPGASSSTDAT